MNTMLGGLVKTGGQRREHSRSLCDPGFVGGKHEADRLTFLFGRMKMRNFMHELPFSLGLLHLSGCFL